MRSKQQPMNKYSTRILHDRLKKLVHKEMEREEFDQAKKLAEEAKQKEIDKHKFEHTPWE